MAQQRGTRRLRQEPGENGPYTYDHSIKSYLIGVDPHLFASLDLNSDPAVRRDVLQRLLPD
jgi:hypothetical protein